MLQARAKKSPALRNLNFNEESPQMGPQMDSDFLFYWFYSYLLLYIFRFYWPRSYFYLKIDTNEFFIVFSVP